jgi:hypothetical protein
MQGKLIFIHARYFSESTESSSSSHLTANGELIHVKNKEEQVKKTHVVKNNQHNRNEHIGFMLPNGQWRESTID